MGIEVIEIRWSWDHPVIQELLLKYYRDWLFNTPKTAYGMVQRVLNMADLKPPGRIADVGCGLGYHAVAFAHHGFQVMAFDPGNKYLEIARKHIAEAGAEVEVRQMSCNQLSETEHFSLAWAGWYCPGQLSPPEVVRDFHRVYEALVPGGWFISNVAGKAKVPPSDKVRTWGELSDCFVLTEKWADDTFFYENSWFVYPGSQKVIKVVEVERMYGVNEIIPLLKEAGFIDITAVKNIFDETPAQVGKHFAFWCRRPQT